jgi:hypothetical protein
VCVAALLLSVGLASLADLLFLCIALQDVVVCRFDASLIFLIVTVYVCDSLQEPILRPGVPPDRTNLAFIQAERSTALDHSLLCMFTTSSLSHCFIIHVQVVECNDYNVNVL